MTWTNTGGGDHEGAAWTPADTTIIAGIHYNISTFTVPTGYNLPIDDAAELEVYANTISVIGTINGNGKGRAGGAVGIPGSSGTGPGGGVGGAGTSEGGGGGGYGGAGGQGYIGNAGGVAHGSNSTIDITMGGGGGGGYSGNTGDGGNGGGSILLSANTLTISGTVQCNGINGVSASAANGGGAGGAGGGILLVGCIVNVSNSTLTADGGNGGNGGVTTGGGGGGGAGGRIKIFYRTLTTTGSTITVAYGTGGSGGSGNGWAGVIGTNYNDEIAQCTSTLEFGQTFTPSTPGKLSISAVTLWVNSVVTSGDFTLTIYDDTGKGTNYGSKSITVSGTGATTWTFTDWVILPDGTSEYYMELVADGAGDIDLGIYGNEPISGDYYFNSEKVERFAAYIVLTGIGNVGSPSIYNTADTTVKCDMANLMLAGAIHKIKTDGTGTFQYSDDFSTAKYGQDTTIAGTVTYDSVNDEVDIAASSSMYWKCDTKHPPTGVPTFEARINITAGIPTIKIAADSGGSPDTWYDIDTAIVDDVLTVYALDNAANLSIKKTGTPFYVKIDCGAGVTASIKSIQIDADLVTIDVEHPIISHDGVSTFRCDQDASSGMNCDVTLSYRNRSWPA